MKKTHINSIEHEEVLAKNVLDHSGNVLLKKGTTIGPSLAGRLKNWGVMSIYIEGEDQADATTGSSHTDAKALQTQLNDKFAGTMHNPLMKKIFAAVYRHRTQ
jgi:hypothetical protein